MNDGITGVLVLVSIATICSLVFHYYIQQSVVAVIMSGLIGTLLFQVAADLHTGYLDPFFPIAAFISFLVIGAISSLIGFIKKQIHDN